MKVKSSRSSRNNMAAAESVAGKSSATATLQTKMTGAAAILSSTGKPVQRMYQQGTSGNTGMMNAANDLRDRQTKEEREAKKKGPAGNDPALLEKIKQGEEKLRESQKKRFELPPRGTKPNFGDD